MAGSWDKTLRVWDVSTGLQTEELLKSSAVKCVAVCGRNENLALGLRNGTLTVLDGDTRSVVFEDVNVHVDSVASVAFSPDGSYLVTGSYDKTVAVWDTERWTRIGERLGYEDRVTSVAFSVDGKQIASSSHDSTIRQWDIASGQCVGVYPKLSFPVQSLSFTVDGERIISGSRDGLIRVWDVPLGVESREESRGHVGAVLGVSISHDGRLVASASKDRTVRLWDVRTGEQIGVALEGHSHEVTSVSISPDGRQVVSGSLDRTLRLWDAETHAQVGGPIVGHGDGVHSVSFSSDRSRIVSGSDDRTVRIWNAQTQEQIGEVLQGHAAAVGHVTESADGRFIVSRDAAGSTMIWNRGNRGIVWRSEGVENGSDVADDDRNSHIVDRAFENGITDYEAEGVIRSCGQQTPNLWPISFPAYSAELYFDEGSVYADLLDQRIWIADGLLGDCSTYDTHGNVFAAGLYSGFVAICKLITE